MKQSLLVPFIYSWKYSTVQPFYLGNLKCCAECQSCLSPIETGLHKLFHTLTQTYIQVIDYFELHHAHI